MMLKIIISSLILFLASQVSTQIDTVAIEQELNLLNNLNAHKQYWKNIYRSDQHFRGDRTNDSIDLLNLLKSCMYFNKFGYPTSATSGKESYIIQYVWIHNSIPKANKLTFTMIFKGYLNKEISEEDLRYNFIRSIYKEKFNDKGYQTKPIKLLLNQLEIKISDRINIAYILEQYKRSKDFMSQAHIEIGCWKRATEYDTLYHNGNPIIKKKETDPIRIFQDQTGDLYIHFLYKDGSHYPQLIKKDNLGKYRIFKESENYYQILNNGDLKVHYGSVEATYKPYIEN